METVPILVYHSVSDDPPAWIRSLSVTPEMFLRQLELISETGATTLSVSAFVDAIARRRALPQRAVLITFDDGLADFRKEAMPALREKRFVATLYVTTGFLDGPDRKALAGRPDGPWLESSALPELRGDGVEIGGHTHSHPQLDTLSLDAARREIDSCKGILEHVLQERVRSFAYPYGFFSRSVRELVHESGYDSACACKNALSTTDDDLFGLARLMVRRTTSLAQFREWLEGRGAPVAPLRESARTRAWRVYRRGRASAQRRSARIGSE